ncbi:MAG: autotransporter outer membrane beta-barrel domain-containing protein [Burkholderiales bacterium]|nr:autotransporter outer membrane beta-barrel domain-containing protein [Burkholderiales bacterium]
MRKKLLAFLSLSSSCSIGAVLPLMVVESEIILSESIKLDDYSGVVGTSSTSRQTISAAGTGFTASPNGTTFYVFFSQTLANDLYYEARLSGRYNYASSNPNIPGIPASQLTPPMGYGTNWFLGYNFHPTEKVNLTPYLRLNVSHNISGAVFDDSNGDYVNSTSYATLIGAKLSFRASEVLSPYINIWGGLQRNYLVGAYPNSQTQSNTPVSGILNQIPITYQIGFGMKLTNAVTLLPYWQYTVTINNPDTNAALAIDQGGLNQSSLTGTSYAYGLKLSIAW